MATYIDKKHSILIPAVLIAAAHLLFSTLIQVENFFLYIHHSTDGIEPAARFLCFLPISQLEHLLFAIILGFPALFILGIPLLKWVYFMVLILANSYLILDQFIFSIFFDHFQLSMSEGRAGSFSALQDSILAEIHPIFYFNLTVLFLISLYLHKFFSLPKAHPRSHHIVKSVFFRKSFGLATVIFLALSVLARISSENHNLEHHAMFSLIRSAFAESAELERPKELVDNLYGLRFADAKANSDQSHALQKVANEISKQKSNPNIIQIILESVGSLQMVPKGGLSERVTPNLHSMAKHMVLFDSIYSTFPGTIRTHVPINTGGRTITWGSVFDELSMEYKGPVLVKELKKAGYRTAVLSAGDFETENLGGFYHSLGYDYVFEPGLESKEFVEKYKIHSWGVNEDILRQRSMKWIDEVSKEKQPFFLQFLTISTHHPYGIPKNYEGPLKGKDRETRYYNSLHYNDNVIGALVKDLEKRKLLDNTLIFISGDHGQAFGKHHRKNFTHKNFLYEENVKNFLMVLDFASIKNPIISNRVGFVGDIMPTLLSLVNAPIPEEILGQDLFDKNYQEKVVYFHKNATPELWGLREGKWKFIAQKTDNNYPELYNLESDPYEQINLSESHQDQVEIYEKLCRQWFIQTNDDYTQRLKDYAPIGGRGLTGEEITSFGPKILAFGYKPSGGHFVELPKIHPYEKMVVWTKWISYPTDKTFLYEWTSPSQEKRSFTFKVQPEWSKTWVYHDAFLPMEEGKWELTLYDGDEKLVSGAFVVDKEAKLQSSSKAVVPQIKAINVSFRTGEQESVESDSSNTGVLLAAESKWYPRKFNYKINHEWLSPSGIIQTMQENLPAESEWLDSKITLPKEPGKWTVHYKTTDGQYLGKKTVLVELTDDNQGVKISDVEADFAVTQKYGDNIQVISFVHFNDLHANYHPINYNGKNLSPLSLIRGYYNQVKSENPNTIFCSAGDEMEKGSLVDLISDGESTIQIYKALGLDLRAIGNHDFAYSLESIRRFVDEPGDMVLCANQSLGKNFHEFEVDGVKFGVFSMVCEPWDERDKQYTGPFYPEVEARYDFVKVAQEIVDRHRKDVDVLFMLSHLGLNGDKRVSNNVKGIDFIIGGHSHTLLKSAKVSSHGTAIVQAGAWGEHVGRFDLFLDKNSKKRVAYEYSVTKVHPDNMAPDLNLEHKIRDILMQYHGHVETPIVWLDKGLNPVEIAQLTARAAKFQFNADAALIDKETVWSSLAAGPHSRQDMLDCFKVEIQRCGTHGFTSMLTAEIIGKDLEAMRKNVADRFLYDGPLKIDPQKSYRLAIQRRTALRVNEFFNNINSLAQLNFEMEMWELLTHYFLKTNKNQSPSLISENEP